MHQQTNIGDNLFTLKGFHLYIWKIKHFDILTWTDPLECTYLPLDTVLSLESNPNSTQISFQGAL